jgi:TetR/AcrR family transcriptional regulator, transcriptional repressor for nem operon
MRMTIRARSKGEQTRERLLDLAEDAVLHKGFAGTSLDELIAAAGLTKSGFFYHFRDKNDLAKALLQRYLETEDVLFDTLMAKADALNEDPLHGFLVFLKLFADMMADLPTGHPGCIVASYCYQDQLFSQEVRDLNGAGLAAWRTRFRARLDAIAVRYPPKIDIDLDTLADMLSAVCDGGIILSKSLRDPSLLPRQVMLYRSFVKLVFLGP